MLTLRRFLPALAALLGVAHAAYAIFGDKPWDKLVLKRLATGRPLLAEHHATISYWHASVIGSVVMIAVALLLWKAFRVEPKPLPPVQPRPKSRWFALGLCGVLLVAAGVRVPRMTHSFWNDEMHALEMFVLGETLEKGSRYDCAESWATALRSNPTANNHVMCTIETRLMHALWLKVKAPEDKRQFSEVFLRTPAFVWGLVFLSVMAVLGYRLGGTALGLGVAAILAMHPWCIRFAAEARGYSAMLAGISLTLLCLHWLLTTNTRSAWAWGGLVFGELLAVLGYPVAGAFLLGILVPAGLWLLKKRDWQRLLGITAASLVAMVAFVDVFLPLAAQVAVFAKEVGKTQFPAITTQWMADTFSGVICGQEWTRGYFSTHTLPLWQKVALLAGFGGLVGLGSTAVWRSGSAFLKKCLLAGVVAFGLIFLQNVVSGLGMLSWYYCFTLPSLAVVMAAGVQLNRPVWFAALGLWCVGLLPSWDATIRHERHPLRSAAQFVRENYPKAFPAYMGITYRHVEPYLASTDVLKCIPGRLDGVNDLRDLEAKGVRKERPVILWFSGRQEHRTPETWNYIAKAGYKEVACFRGIDEMFDVYVMEQANPAGR